MTKPYPYQLEGIRKIQLFKGRVILSDEMGLGKSLQALLWRDRHATGKRTLIVCPAHLKWNWQREASHHLNLRTEILSTRTPFKSALRCKTLIINYEIFPHWSEYLWEWDPEVLILDEGHYLKNPSAKRTKSIRRVAKFAKHVLVLTGTPITNRPSELWSLLNVVRPDLYPKFWPFAQKHCAPKRTRYGWDFSGSARLKELHTDLKSTLMIRRLKKDVLGDLPEKTRTVVPLEIEDREQYDLTVEDFTSWLETHAPEKMKKGVKVRALARISEVKQLIHRLKLKSACEWVDSFLKETDGKIILFCWHRKMVANLMERYSRLAVRVDGSVGGAKRQQAVDSFTHDTRKRILVGNIKAAGTGWNGTAASTVAFLELGWTPGEMIQAEDRIHRIGQSKKSSVYYLIARGTYEEKLCKLLNRKQKNISRAIDGGAGRDTDVLGELIAFLKGGGK